MRIRTPILDLHLDRFLIQILLNGLRSKSKKLFIRCKSQGNNLLDRKPWVHQLAGHHKVTQILLSPHSTVLRLQRKRSAEESSKEDAGSQH